MEGPLPLRYVLPFILIKMLLSGEFLERLWERRFGSVGLGSVSDGRDEKR